MFCRLNVWCRGLIAGGLIFGLCSTAPAGADVETVLRAWLQNAGAMPADVAGLSTRPHWRKIYSERAYAPLWFDARGVNHRARELLSYLAKERHGLEYTPIYLPLGEISAQRMASIELQLTQALLRTAFSLHGGQTEPSAVDAAWHLKRPRLDPERIIRPLTAGESVDSVLEGLAPRASGYRRLRRALGEYRAMARAGGFPHLSAGASLKPGDIDPQVRILRRRLMRSGDLSGAQPSDRDYFDPHLADAVRRFQTRHGLKVDAIVGPKTRAALNVPVSVRISQIRASLERWRWLPRTGEERYVIVNVAGFQLSLYESERRQLTMRVIVGRPEEDWETPAFASSIRYLTLNPGWTVPQAIARDELLPKLLSDPAYFIRQRIQAYAGGEPVELTRDDVLATLKLDEEEPFPYVFKQKPGSWNALGRIKLMLPNRFAIYLHDTPARHLFTRRERAFSHGCVRLEKPFVLAAALLDDTWDTEKLLAEVETGERRKISLPEPVPVYFVYQTAWVDPDGQVQFRNDIYGRNRKLVSALRGESLDIASNVN